MERLKPEDILTLHQTVTSLALDRDALLSGLPPALVANLPRARRLSEQLLIDLHALNDLEPLSDGSVPLHRWLQNALAVAAPSPRSRVLSTCLRSLILPSELSLRPSRPRRRWRLFLSCSVTDQLYQDELSTTLRRNYAPVSIDHWAPDGPVVPPAAGSPAAERLAASDIGIVFLSPDLLASDHFWQARVYTSSPSGILVVPVLVRPCDWRSTELGGLPSLPSGDKAISLLPNRDDAWRDVAATIAGCVAFSDATLLEPAHHKVKLTLRLEGDAATVDAERRRALQNAIGTATGDEDVKITRLRSGSIVVELEISEESAALLIKLYQQGSLKDILGHRIVSMTPGADAEPIPSSATAHAVIAPMQSTPFGSSPAPIRILFLAANPVNEAKLRLDEEVREITAKVRAADQRARLHIIQRWATRPDDLLQALNEDKPHIVHFSGHGGSTGDLCFLDRDGKSKSVSCDALRAVFHIFRQSVRMIVLNACYSEAQARVLSEFIDCTIGMSKEIGDDAAITFSSSFYRALGFGTRVKDAFDQGIAAIQLEGLQQKKRTIPKLHVRDGLDPLTLSI